MVVIGSYEEHKRYLSGLMEAKEFLVKERVAKRDHMVIDIDRGH